MAIEDIISEEITTQDPNMQIAQGSPDDFMSEDEMDPYQDPEFQQLLDSMPAEQAQALMQLIKEYKEMVAKGFQGEFEDFVKIKMATAQGDDVEFQSEDEMIIEPDEMMDIEKQIVPTEMAANGGRIGYNKGGGADWINTHEPGPMGNPPVFEEIEDMREWRIANPDVEDVADYKGYYERLKKKRKKKQEGGIMDVVEEDEVVETGPTRQQMIIDYLKQRGLPITPENIQKAIIEMITGGIPYTEEASYDMPQMDRQSVLTRGMMVDASMLDRTPSCIASVNVMEDIIPQPRPYLYDAPPAKLPFEKQQSTMFAAEGGFADDMSVVSKVDPSRRSQIEGNQMAEDAINQILYKFYEKFPGVDTTEMSIEDMIAELQAEGVFETEGLGILGLDKAMDMITPESVRASAQAISRHHLQEGGRIGAADGYKPGDFLEFLNKQDPDVIDPFEGVDLKLYKELLNSGMDETEAYRKAGGTRFAAGGRVPYGLGSLVKKIFKPIKKVGSKLVKSVKKFAKSDLGKAALMYMATAGAANIMQPGAASWASPFTKGAGTGWLRPDTVLGNLGKSYTGLKEAFTSPASKAITNSGTGVIESATADALPVKSLVKNYVAPKEGIMSKLATSFKENPMPWIIGSSLAGGAYTAANPGEENLDRLMADRNKEVADWDNIMANIRSGQTVTPFTTGNVMFPYPNYYLNVAEGGRIGRAEGGIMDLGGMEKDYRETGGFVPIGEYEKKDDVPARLSLNEFVMTADAVRGAGNGDVDKGAEVMEDMMETLEAKGRRHRQAQDMFSVSERLSEVVN